MHIMQVFNTHTILLQIKVYAEAGGRPQTWDMSQKGTIKAIFNKDIKLLKWPISLNLIFKLCFAEYALVSISLVLIIAKFFPVYHSKLVSKATTPEYKSLYWGAAVVSNCFTLGLLFPFGREVSIVQCLVRAKSNNYYFITHDHSTTIKTLLPILEISMYIVFFVAAVIATRRSNVGIIHIPKGMAKVLIHISSCFCCCCCCSLRCRAKAIQVLVLFSFMSFIYHSIMDAISVGYLLFVSVSETFTMTMLYISLLFFLVSLTSFILYTTSSNRGDSRSAVKGSVMCVVGACTLLIIFGAVILIVAVYVAIITSLKPKGVIGFLTTLIPSLGLSAAGWFIKKKLQSEVQSHQQASDYGATGQSLNDGRREDRENSEDTEEQRHLLA